MVEKMVKVRGKFVSDGGYRCPEIVGKLVDAYIPEEDFDRGNHRLYFVFGDEILPFITHEDPDPFLPERDYAFWERSEFEVDFCYGGGFGEEYKRRLEAIPANAESKDSANEEDEAEEGPESLEERGRRIASALIEIGAAALCQ